MGEYTAMGFGFQRRENLVKRALTDLFREPLCGWFGCFLLATGLLLWLPALLHAQAPAAPDSTAEDTLNIQYQLVETHYLSMEDVFKIKVPPYLTTAEVMEQIRLAVRWPGDPPPRKITTVYVFRDGQKRGASSKTGGIYVPGKGFRWDMADWEPDVSILEFQPSDKDKLLYNFLLDTLFAAGISSEDMSDSTELPIKKAVARDFEMSVAQLDSVYYHVKWWIDLQRRLRKL